MFRKRKVGPIVRKAHVWMIQLHADYLLLYYSFILKVPVIFEVLVGYGIHFMPHFVSHKVLTFVILSLMWFGLNPGLVIFRHSNPAVTQLVLLMDKKSCRRPCELRSLRTSRSMRPIRGVVTKLGRPMCQPPRP